MNIKFSCKKENQNKGTIVKGREVSYSMNDWMYILHVATYDQYDQE